MSIGIHIPEDILTPGTDFTESDTVALETPARGFILYGVGDVVVKTPGGQRTINDTIFASNIIHSLSILQVYATGTTNTTYRLVI